MFCIPGISVRFSAPRFAWSLSRPIKAFRLHPSAVPSAFATSADGAGLDVTGPPAATPFVDHCWSNFTSSSRHSGAHTGSAAFGCQSDIPGGLASQPSWEDLPAPHLSCSEVFGDPWGQPMSSKPSRICVVYRRLTFHNTYQYVQTCVFTDEHAQGNVA